MKFDHEKLHARAVGTAREYLKRETELIGIFQELDKYRTFEHFGMPSLFAYSVKFLGLSETTTSSLTKIARVSCVIPELKEAIESKAISFSNARRIAPVLKTENKNEWLEKAASLPVRKLELELAKSFPDCPAPTRVFPKSETLGRLEVDLPNATLAKLKRAQEILSQKKKTNINAAKALEAMLDEFIERHDPVEKAKRAQEKPTKLNKSPVPGVEGKPDSPEFLLAARRMGIFIPPKATPAKEKHNVIHRDQGQCTHVDTGGSRCASRQWLDLHHNKHRAHGGADTAENLRTLCSAHHRLMHAR